MRQKVRLISSNVSAANNNILQMNPPPSEPLYVIGVRSILLYLREYNEIEDLGLNKQGGVVTILSDALNWRGLPGYRQLNGNYESWMDAGSYVMMFRGTCG